MKIEMTTSMAGVRFVRNAGDVVDVDNDEGKRLIAAGFAIPVRGNATVETAMADPKRKNRSKN